MILLFGPFNASLLFGRYFCFLFYIYGRKRVSYEILQEALYLKHLTLRKSSSSLFVYIDREGGDKCRKPISMMASQLSNSSTIAFLVIGRLKE